jgi:hypothetical protein
MHERDNLIVGGTMDILKALHDERSKLQQQIDTVDAAIKIFGGTNTGNPKNGKSKHKMSAASRRKMSLAAKKRWAEKKKAK